MCKLHPFFFLSPLLFDSLVQGRHSIPFCYWLPHVVNLNIYYHIYLSQDKEMYFVRYLWRNIQGLWIINVRKWSKKENLIFLIAWKGINKYMNIEITAVLIDSFVIQTQLHKNNPVSSQYRLLIQLDHFQHVHTRHIYNLRARMIKLEVHIPWMWHSGINIQ